MIDYTDPLNKIVRAEIEKLGKMWVEDSKNWHKVFKSSLKRFFFFPMADEKWTYFVFFQPNNVWPTSNLTPSEYATLSIMKLVSFSNKRNVYVDRGAGIDPETPHITVSEEETAQGLKLWAKAAEKKILSKMFQSYKKVVLKGAERIKSECPEYFGENCTQKQAIDIFQNTAMDLARADALPIKTTLQKAYKEFSRIYRV